MLGAGVVLDTRLFPHAFMFACMYCYTLNTASSGARLTESSLETTGQAPVPSKT